jgi:hypothetical protein
LYKNRFFKVEAYHSDKKTLLNVSELYKVINSIVQNYANESHGIGVGALTADNRDSWAKVSLF